MTVTVIGGKEPPGDATVQ